jgi:hypothetical protein
VIELKPFKVIPQTHSSPHRAVTRHIFEGSHGGWAYAYVDDNSGILVIVSDWETWSHRWHATPAALGAPTLTHFLATRSDTDYLGRKLTTEHGRKGDGKPARSEFNRAATVKQFRKLLVENRRKVADCPTSHRLKGLTRDMARSLWNRLDELDADEPGRFLDQFWEMDDHALIDDSGELYEAFVYSPTNTYMVLTKCILSALITSCATTIAAREADAELYKLETFVP